MNIHEYQAKSLLAKYGVAVPKGGVAFTPEEAENAARELGGPDVLVNNAALRTIPRAKAACVSATPSTRSRKTPARCWATCW